MSLAGPADVCVLLCPGPAMMRPVLEPGVSMLQQGLSPPETLLVTGLGVEFRQTSAIAGVFGVLRILFPTG